MYITVSLKTITEPKQTKWTYTKKKKKLNTKNAIIYLETHVSLTRKGHRYSTIIFSISSHELVHFLPPGPSTGLFQHCLISNPMLKSVRADSIAFSSPVSIASLFNPPPVSTDNWVGDIWFWVCSVSLSCEFVFMEAGAAAATRGALGGPCRFLGTGVSWSCTPLYVIIRAVVLSTALSMCFRTGHPAEVHL